MPVLANFEFLRPWQVIETSPKNRSALLSARLEQELPTGHVLKGLRATAVATRVDQDDVLFEIEGGELPLAVVHMTCGKETDPRWPLTKLFPSWEHWVLEDMRPAHKDHAGS